MKYPASRRARDAWIVAQRGERETLDPWRPYAYSVEPERAASGEVVDVATIFLTNRECPWRCLMCDLWRHTLTESVPMGAIPTQIDYALGRLPPARHVKLYNAGSYFDPRAIPPQDDVEVARRLTQYEYITVESHPALIADRCWRFQELLAGSLEVAMGLETVHPEALAKLNKGMTLEQFAAAAEALQRHGIALRAFVLLQPPFVPPEEAVRWAVRSLEFAFDCGATACTVIPTRAGNGALDELARAGSFSEPTLDQLEEAVEQGLALGRGRVFADLWDLERFSQGDACFAARRERLEGMNLSQQFVTRHQ